MTWPDFMWLFTVPVLKVAIKVGVTFASLFLTVQVVRWSCQAKARDPFDRRRRRKDEDGGRSFSAKPFRPEELLEEEPGGGWDAVVIGGGASGLCAAAVLTLSGKKPLVLEERPDPCIRLKSGFGRRAWWPSVWPPEAGLLLWEIASPGGRPAKADEPDEAVVVLWGGQVHRLTLRPGESLTEALLGLHTLPGQAPSSSALDKVFGAADNALQLFRKSMSRKLRPAWMVSGGHCFWAAPWGVSDEPEVLPLLGGGDAATVRSFFSQSVVEGDPVLLTFLEHFSGSQRDQSGKASIFKALMNLSSMASRSRSLCTGSRLPSGNDDEEGRRLFRAIAATIEAGGGKVLTEAKVTSVMYGAGGKAVGVKVKSSGGVGGPEVALEAPALVSSVNLEKTFGQLLPRGVVPPALAKYLKVNKGGPKRKAPASGAIVPFRLKVDLGVDMDLADLGILRPTRLTVYSPGAAEESSPDAAEEFCHLQDPPCVRATFPRDSSGTLTATALCRAADDDWLVQLNSAAPAQPLTERTLAVLGRALGTELPISGAAPEEGCRPEDEGPPRDDPEDDDDDLFRARLRPDSGIAGLYLARREVASPAEGLAGELLGGLLAAGAVLDRDVYADLLRLLKVHEDVEEDDEEGQSDPQGGDAGSKKDN